MDIQGYSPLPQPANVFTLEEYQALLSKHREIYQTQWDRERPEEERARIRQQVHALQQAYYHRLPVYLLARCPLCGGRVWEAIDTFSLNGLAWGAPHGFGWRGGGWSHEKKKYLYSFTAECEHAQFMTYSVNLNGLQPTDVYRFYPLGPEKPFMLRFFGNSFKAVMHSLPLGRYDDTTPIPRYTIYFVTYFTAVADALRRAIVTGDPSDGGRAFFYHEADYNLQRRVEKGQLYWLDTENPDLPLKNSPTESFPYAAISGMAEEGWLMDGMLEAMSARQQRQEAESARQQQEGPQEGCLMSFLKGLFGPKDQ